MSDIHTDLVVRISASDSNSGSAGAALHDKRHLIMELKRCLQPGAEIALVFEGYMAMTSILWLSDLEPDGSVRAGVRLIGVSALPNDKVDVPTTWNEVSRHSLSEQIELASLKLQHL